MKASSSMSMKIDPFGVAEDANMSCFGGGGGGVVTVQNISPTSLASFVYNRHQEWIESHR